jgi:hypothetical protein
MISATITFLGDSPHDSPRNPKLFSLLGASLSISTEEIHNLLLTLFYMALINSNAEKETFLGGSPYDSRRNPELFSLLGVNLSIITEEIHNLL